MRSEDPQLPDSKKCVEVWTSTFDHDRVTGWIYPPTLKTKKWWTKYRKQWFLDPGQQAVEGRDPLEKGNKQGEPYDSWLPGLSTGKGSPNNTEQSPWAAKTESRLWGGQGSYKSQERTSWMERRKVHRETFLEISWGLLESQAEYWSVHACEEATKTMKGPPQETSRNIPGTHARLGVLCVPTSQSGKMP